MQVLHVSYTYHPWAFTTREPNRHRKSIANHTLDVNAPKNAAVLGTAASCSSGSAHHAWSVATWWLIPPLAGRYLLSYRCSKKRRSTGYYGVLTFWLRESRLERDDMVVNPACGGTLPTELSQLVVIEVSLNAALLDLLLQKHGFGACRRFSTPDAVPRPRESLCGLAAPVIRVVVLADTPFEVVRLAAEVAAGRGTLEDIDMERIAAPQKKRRSTGYYGVLTFWLREQDSNLRHGG